MRRLHNRAAITLGLVIFTVTTLLTSIAKAETFTSIGSIRTSTVIPKLVICGGPATYKPTALHWCSSLCSSYVKNLKWSEWSSKSAVGIGTLMTNNGHPNCAQGRWSAHPNYSVTLSKPMYVSYCDGARLVKRL